MKNYSVDKIRNIVLMGHGGTGKTTLCESILFSLGVTKRMGRVEDGNTVADFDKEEIFRKFTIGTSLIPVEHSEHKFNLLDTPGYFDFVGEVKGAMKAASGAVIMVDASAGVQVGTEKAWDLAETAGIPRIIFINKMDKDNLDIPKVFNDLKETFGKKIAPFVYPIGDGANFKGYINIVDVKAREFEGRNYREIPMPAGYEETIAPIREMLLEAVAESDESMMAKYFSGEEFTADEIHAGLRKGSSTPMWCPSWWAAPIRATACSSCWRSCGITCRIPTRCTVENARVSIPTTAARSFGGWTRRSPSPLRYSRPS